MAIRLNIDQYKTGVNTPEVASPETKPTSGKIRLNLDTYGKTPEQEDQSMMEKMIKEKYPDTDFTKQTIKAAEPEAWEKVPYVKATVDVIKDTFKDTTQRLGDFFETFFAGAGGTKLSTYQEAPTSSPEARKEYIEAQPKATGAEIAGKGISAVTGVGNLLFAPVSSQIEAGKTLPGPLSWPSKGISTAFEITNKVLGEAGTTFVNEAVDILPIDDAMKEDIKSNVAAPFGELAAFAGTVGIFKLAHMKTKGLKESKIVKAIPIAESLKGGAIDVTAKTAQFGMSPATTALGIAKGLIFRKINDRVADGKTLTKSETDQIVSEVAKEVPMETIKLPEVTAWAKQRIREIETKITEATGKIGENDLAELEYLKKTINDPVEISKRYGIPIEAKMKINGVEVITEQPMVLKNMIRGQEKIDFVKRDALGKDINGSEIQARFTWDYKNQRGRLEYTDKSTGEDLAHEFGHYIDRAVATKTQQRLTDILPDYAENRKEIERSLTGYVVAKRGGKAKSAEIQQEVFDLVTSFPREINALIKGGARKPPAEKFADAVKEILARPTEAKKMAPNLFDFVNYFEKSGRKNIITKTVKAATGKKKAEKKKATPEEREKVEKKLKENQQFYQDYGGAGAGKEKPNVALMRIKEIIKTETGKEIVREKINEAIKSGEIRKNSDGTITLYRAGKVGKVNELVSASYDRDQAMMFKEQVREPENVPFYEFKVRPEDIDYFVGGSEKEVLLDRKIIMERISGKMPKVKAEKKLAAKGTREAAEDFIKSRVMKFKRDDMQKRQEALEMAEDIRKKIGQTKEQQLQAKAVAIFGKTTDETKSLFILEDGSLLGNRGLESGGEHRVFSNEVLGIYPRAAGQNLANAAGMVEMVSVPGRELTARIYGSATSEQVRKIMDLASDKPEVYIDVFQKNSRSKVLRSYDKNSIMKFFVTESQTKYRTQAELLTTRVLKAIGDKPMVKIETIKNQLNQQGVKQQEKLIVLDALASFEKEAKYYRAGALEDVRGTGIFLSTSAKIAEQYGKDVKQYKIPSDSKIYKAENRWKLVKEVDKKWDKEKIYDKEIKKGMVGNISPEQRLQAEAEKRIMNALKNKGYDGVEYTGGLTDQKGELQFFNSEKLEQTKPGEIPTAEFKKRVQEQLLPLKLKSTDTVGGIGEGTELSSREIYEMREEGLLPSEYENVTLPDELRGQVVDYAEHIWESPIKTKAGYVHFRDYTDSYFGHTRIEDMANTEIRDRIIAQSKGRPMTDAEKKEWEKSYNGTTRRVIEVQSDLYQRGRLEDEMNEYFSDPIKETEAIQVYREGKRELYVKYEDGTESLLETEQAILNAYDRGLNVVVELPSGKKRVEAARLGQYTDPTAHFRMVREEVAMAARDGKTKLQFPTGETAMKVEGLGIIGGQERWNIVKPGKYTAWDLTEKLTPENMKSGMEIDSAGIGLAQGETGRWIITDVLGDGKFKAVSKNRIERWIKEENSTFEQVIKNVKDSNHREQETFDISGKIDTSNPIYKFYEKDLAKYLRSRYQAKTITDALGVTWNEVEIKPEMAGAVEAFRIRDDFAKIGIQITSAQEAKIKEINKKFFGNEDVKFVEQILTPDGQEALGAYKDAMIRVLRGQGNAKDTYLHEAVHKYLDVVTTADEHVDLLLAGKEKYGIDDFAQIEEMIAEDFIKFAKTHEGITGKLKIAFNKIMTRIERLFGNEDKIKELYADIMSGKGRQADKTVPEIGFKTKAEAKPISPTQPEEVKAKSKQETPQATIAGTGLRSGHLVKRRLSYNPDKFNTAEDVENLFKDISAEKGEFQRQRISKTNEDIKRLSSLVNMSAEDLIKVKPGSIANAETVKRAIDLSMDSVSDLRDYLREVDVATATPEQMSIFKKKLLRTQGIMKTVAGFRTEASNVFRTFNIERTVGENNVLKEILAILKKADVETAGLEEFAKKTNKVMEPTAMDKFWHLWYASVLSGGSTQLKNFGGNLFNLTGEVAVHAITEPRAIPEVLRGLWDGLAEGKKEAARIWKEGDVNKFEERGIKPVKFTLGAEKHTGFQKQVRERAAWVLNRADYVGRFMAATDAIFREGFKGMELRAIVREQLAKQGYADADIKAKLDQAVKDADVDAINEAAEYALRGTYNNKPQGAIGAVATNLGRLVRQVEQKNTAAGMMARFVLPFTRVVANVTNVAIDWTPYGLKRALMNKELTSRAKRQEFGRAFMGTAAMFYLANLAAQGLLSGTGPTDSKKKQQLKDGGWQPNSIKIGDKWYPYQNWGPMALGMTIVGNAYDYSRYGKETEEDLASRLTLAFLGTGKSILDTSFLSGISSLSGALDNMDRGGDKYFEYLIASQASTVVPALVKQTARYFDTTQYETTDIKSRILSNLRITSGLKPRLNVFGQPIKGQALTQISPTTITKDETLKFLAENSIWITVPSKNTMIRPIDELKTLPKGGRPMTEDEYYNYVKYSGIEIKKRLDQALPRLKLSTQEQAEKHIDDIVQAARESTKRGIALGLIK